MLGTLPGMWVVDNHLVSRGLFPGYNCIAKMSLLLNSWRTLKGECWWDQAFFGQAVNEYWFKSGSPLYNDLASYTNLVGSWLNYSLPGTLPGMWVVNDHLVSQGLWAGYTCFAELSLLFGTRGIPKKECQKNWAFFG